MRTSVEAARARMLALEQELDIETTREKLAAFLNIIGLYMTEYSAALDLEHKGSQLRLDIRNLTVVADTMDGPVPLYRMGSGENWVGYHVLSHLALHKVSSEGAASAGVCYLRSAVSSPLPTGA